MRAIFCLFLVIIWLGSCQNATRKEAGKISLFKYGIPVHVKVPDGARFNKASSGNIESLSIVHDDGFNLQVLLLPTSYTDVKMAKNHQRDLVVNQPDFSKIIEDYDAGFLFELRSESAFIYDFRFVKILGTKEVVFQAGPTCFCTEAMVRNMYVAVQ